MPNNNLTTNFYYGTATTNHMPNDAFVVSLDNTPTAPTLVAEEQVPLTPNKVKSKKAKELPPINSDEVPQASSWMFAVAQHRDVSK